MQPSNIFAVKSTHNYYIPFFFVLFTICAFLTKLVTLANSSLGYVLCYLTSTMLNQISIDKQRLFIFITTAHNPKFYFNLHTHPTYYRKSHLMQKKK